MARSATIASKSSSRTGLIVGTSLAVATVVIAVIAAKPGSTLAESTGKVPAAAATTPGTASAAAATTVSTRAAGGLTAREASFDFGSISMAAGKVSHRYWFRNESDTPLLIKRIFTSCMCTTATLVKGPRVIGSYGMPGHGPMPDVNQSFAPGEAAYVDVVFDPAAHGPAGLGRTERVVTIENGSGQQLRLGFVAHVRP